MNYRERTKLIDGLCGTFLMALLVEAFYGLVDYAFTIYHYSIASVTNIVYVIAGIILVASIGILIAAYKKDNGAMGFYGAELMALAITATTLPGTYISLPHPFNKLNVLFPLLFVIYYWWFIIFILHILDISWVQVSNMICEMRFLNIIRSCLLHFLIIRK